MKTILSAMVAGACVMAVPAFAQMYERNVPGYIQNQPTRMDSILGTRAGPDIAIGYGHYVYNEPAVMMTLKANAPTVKVGYTVLADKGGAFSRLEAEGFAADMDYTGSTWAGDEITGTSSDVKIDTRLLFGVDVASTPDFVWAPYVGAGFRYLTDGKGTYSDPAVAGYRRRNLLGYGVMGMDTRFYAWNIPLEWRAEYDGLLFGKQRSYLSDAGTRDVDNTQKSGHGWRTHVAYLNRWIDVGLYFQQWRIADSGVANDGTTDVIEPRNSTREYGVFVRHRF